MARYLWHSMPRHVRRDLTANILVACGDELVAAFPGLRGRWLGSEVEDLLEDIVRRAVQLAPAQEMVYHEGVMHRAVQSLMAEQTDPRLSALYHSIWEKLASDWYQKDSTVREPSKDVVTADAVGLRLVENALRGMKPLDEALRRLEVPAPEAAESYRTELSIFCVFPLEIIVRKELGEHSIDVRACMRAHLLTTLRSPLPRDEEERRKIWVGWNEHAGDRVAEYVAALQAKSTSLPGVEPGLGSLGVKAYHRISGYAQPDIWAVGQLIAHYASTMKHMPSAIAALEVSP